MAGIHVAEYLTVFPPREVLQRKLQEAIAKLKANGIAIDRMVDLPWKSAFFLRDPDGLLSEYYVRRGAKIELAERGDAPLEYAV